MSRKSSPFTLQLTETRILIDPIEALDARILEDLWEFRLRFVDIKPDVGLDVDKRLFKSKVGRGGSVVRFYDRNDALVAFFDFRGQATEFGGRSHLVVGGDFAFFEPEWRRHPALVLTILFTIGAAVRRHGWRRKVWFVGAAYPSAYLSLAGTLSDIRVAGVASNREDVALLEHLGQLLYGDSWVSGHYRVQNRTLPPPFTPPPTVWGRDAFRFYEAVNPDWAAGYSMLLMIPVDARCIAEALWSSTRRSVRRGLRLRSNEASSVPSASK